MQAPECALNGGSLELEWYAHGPCIEFDTFLNLYSSSIREVSLTLNPEARVSTFLMWIWAGYNPLKPRSVGLCGIGRNGKNEKKNEKKN